MKKNQFVLFVLLSTLPFTAKPQSVVCSNGTNVYAEIGGASLMASINAERLFNIGKSSAISCRIGLGIYPSNIFTPVEYSGIVPVMIGFISGKEFAFEAGAGISIGWDDAVDAFDRVHEQAGILKWFNGFLGFRYQKQNRGFLFRFGYTPQFVSKACPDCVNPFNLVGASFGARINSRKHR
jgi:hypothetical protein